MYYWALQDAKAKLSELVRLTLKSGPQGISVRGEKQIVIMAQAEYEKLKGNKPRFIDLVELSPLKGMEIDIERNSSLMRNIEL